MIQEVAIIFMNLYKNRTACYVLPDVTSSFYNISPLAELREINPQGGFYFSLCKGTSKYFSLQIF